MDSLGIYLLGALTTLAIGLILRIAEAVQHRQHWFRDHLREAAESFLTDAQRHLDISWKRMMGQIPDASEVIVEPTAALEVDISRLRLVAPKPVQTNASSAFIRVKAAFDAAQLAGVPLAPAERFTAAMTAAKRASDDLDSFADLVQRNLRYSK